MTFVRSIGRWAMTALVINCIIGGGIFGLPGELTRLLGRASPFAMILAALGMAVILACFAEVASQFSEQSLPLRHGVLSAEKLRPEIENIPRSCRNSSSSDLQT